MQHINLPQQSLHLQWSKWCPISKTNASDAKNWDTLHDTALTSSVMNVMNSDTSSWTGLTEYPLHRHQHQTTRHIEIATTDLALGTTWKTKKEETSPDHSLDTANIIAPAVMACTEAAQNHSNRTGTTTIEAAPDDPIQHTENTATSPAMTNHTSHTTNPPHTAASQATTLRIAVDHTHDQPTDHWNIVHTKNDHAVQDHTSARETKSPTWGRIKRSR